jgi:uncharacterized protein
MVGVDARTGKLVEQTEHIKQSIQRALMTPPGTRLLRPELGFDALDQNTGCLRPELDDRTVEKLAWNYLVTAEPRVTLNKIELKKDGDVVTLTVTYDYQGTLDQVVVVLPIPYEGRIERLERDGFGLVKFDHPITAGERTISVGVIATSGTANTSSGATLGTGVVNLKKGARVRGTALADAQQDLATIRTIDPSPR